MRNTEEEGQPGPTDIVQGRADSSYAHWSKGSIESIIS